MRYSSLRGIFYAKWMAALKYGSIASEKMINKKTE